MKSAEDCIVRYCAAWNEPDAAKRDTILAPVWADGAVYIDPTVRTETRAALIAHIGGVLEKFPDSRVVLTSAVEEHHGQVRFYWRRVLADGTERPEGIDFCEIDADGKLRRVVGFFGPLARR